MTRTIIAVIMLLLGFALLGCNKKEENSAVSSGPPEPIESAFSNLQNDQQGYADVKWGAGITNDYSNTTQRSANCFATGDPRESDAIAAAFRTPIRDYSTPGFVMENLDFSLAPKGCQIATKGEVRFIFYDGKLAMASTQLDAHAGDVGQMELCSSQNATALSSSIWVATSRALAPKSILIV